MKRIVALVCDIIFVWLAGLVLGLAVLPVLIDGPTWLVVIGLAVFWFAVFFYMPLCETFFNGQTLGKKLVGLRVVRTDGSPVSGVHCLQRYIMLLIDVGLTFGAGGLLSAMITERRQRLGDLVADTMVVSCAGNGYYEKNITKTVYDELSPREQAIFERHKPLNLLALSNERIELAQAYRAIECDLVWLRTHRGNPALIDYLESALAKMHLDLFHHKSYTWGDMLKFALRSIPRAVYESRWCVLAALAIVVVAYAIGIYSQCTDPNFFWDIFGSNYAQMTLENIEKGNPMGVYGEQSRLPMTVDIFMNNFLVTLRLYAMGVFPFIGPLFMLLNNFVSFAAFDTFFAQHSCLVDALVSTHEHGVLELSSIIMAGGASIRLGTGWLFPGRLTRLHALVRSARQSLLIVISTVPMLLVAAFIEGFITRHTEWPLSVKLSIIIVSSLVIVGYYVMLPVIAKNQ